MGLHFCFSENKIMKLEKVMRYLANGTEWNSGRATLRRRTTCWIFWLPLLSECLQNRKSSATEKTCHQGITQYQVTWNLSSFDSIYVQQRKKHILEETIDNKQCIFIIRGKSIVVSSRTWSGIHIITVWHAAYFSFYNKAKGLRNLRSISQVSNPKNSL